MGTSKDTLQGPSMASAANQAPGLTGIAGIQPRPNMLSVPNFSTAERSSGNPTPSPSGQTSSTNITSSLPKPFARHEEMKNSVVVSLYKRIDDLHVSLGLQKSEASKLTEQLDEIRAWAKKAQSQATEGHHHNQQAQIAFDKLKKSFQVIDKLLGAPADVDARGESAAAALPTIAETQEATPRTHAAASKAYTHTEIGGSDANDTPPKPSDAPPAGQIIASYQMQNQTAEVTAQSKTSTRATSDHSTATVVPKKPVANPAAAPTDALASLLGETLEASRNSVVASTAATALLTRIPDDFNHYGTLPGQVGTIIGKVFVCDRPAYNPERVPVIRIRNLPTSVSMDELFMSLAGGPLYRVQLNPINEKTKTRDLRITFIHREHAINLLRFATKHQGLLIRGCPQRIEATVDPSDSENRISFYTFRKIMTENCTRMVFVQGLDRRFWTAQKVRQLVITCVERARIEEPRKFRFREPCHITDDILTCKIGMGDSGTLEALVGMRSIAWGLMVRDALNGLKEPEGFYNERVQGELGPPIHTFREGAKPSSVLTAYWGRDPCDTDVNALPT
ncbi:hypothetical protein ABW21_db0200669 [Orbilia brochopaga]|nr:hypothetical protein ABW21_db0200669 [Drechslerella brochopaga]